MEKKLRASQKELDELHRLHRDAISARDAAQKELKQQEEKILSERQRRENELNVMKHVAEGKIEGDESALSRGQTPSDVHNGSVGSDGNSTPTAHGTPSSYGMTYDLQQQKIDSFEEAFALIKEVTGLSEINQIVQRFENQGQTLAQLGEMKANAEDQRRFLREERDRLGREYGELKFSGETQLTSLDNLVEKYTTEAEQGQSKHKNMLDEVSQASQLLVQCKVGIEHIYDKLVAASYDLESDLPQDDEVGATTTTDLEGGEDTGVDTSAETTTTGEQQQQAAVRKSRASSRERLSRMVQLDLSNLLDECNVKLDLLLKDLDVDEIDSQLKLIDKDEFYQHFDEYTPEFNTRVKIERSTPDHLIDDDNLIDENDIPTRNALKKQAAQLVEMRTMKRQQQRKRRRRAKE